MFFWRSDHCRQCFFMLLPSLSMVFDGSGPLVKRCDGLDGSLWSILKEVKRRHVHILLRFACMQQCLLFWYIMGFTFAIRTFVFVARLGAVVLP